MTVCLLRDIATKEGYWNLDFFRLWLLDEIIRRIVGIPPPHPTIGSDIVTWGGTTIGSFTLKSAYGRIREGS